MDEESKKKELREQAKKRREGKRQDRPISDKEALELIEDLSIHQEELKIQNEELLRVHHELESTRAKYFEMYDLAPVGYITLTPELIIKESNLTASKLLGIDRKNLINRGLSSFVSPRSKKSFYLHYRRLAEGNEKQVSTFLVRSMDGGELHVQVESNIVGGGSGSGFRSVLTDVTDRKRAEDEIVRLAAFPRLNPSPIAEFDLDGELLFINPAMESSFPDVRRSGLLHPFFSDWKQIVKTVQNAERRTFRRELKIDKDWLYQQFYFVPELKAVIVYTIKINELKEAENELRRSNEELQQFAYLASHDLQEPLRMVISYLSMLELRYKDQLDPKAQDYIRNAMDGGARMRELIDDLLVYSRIDSKARELGPVDMSSVVAQTLTVLKVLIEESKAEIIVDPLPTVLADRSQMLQVMQNLITNAIKFHGPERPLVHVSVSEGSGGWTFSVKDNGIGLNMEFAERIFQMFQRLHTKEEHPGTGVGLAIVKKIVERQGGRVWVESEEGNGATFYFIIPDAKGEMEDASETY